jgi:beta-lactamase regulating signal transducer with metallopeptidase domain
VDTLLHLGLSNAVLATVLALGVAAVARLWRRPAVVHGLWLLVLLKLLTPPLLPLPVAWPETRPAQTPESQPVSLHAEEPAGPQCLLDTPTRRLHGGGTADPHQPDVPARDATSPSLARRAGEAGEPEPAPVPAPAFSWKVALAIVWVSGSLLWWALAGWRVYRFQALLRHARPAPPGLQAHAARLADRLGRKRCPGVWLVPGPLSPMLWALAGTPRLLLPAGLWDCLSEEQRDTLLLHELAHCHRGDDWVRRLELLALGLYWWHPVAWWARHELQEAEEQCCDAWVVWALPASAAAYADALVATLAFLSRPRAALPMGASGVGRLHPVKRRLSMILRGTTPRALSWPAFLVLLALCGLLPLRPTWAVPAPADEPPASAVVVAEPPVAQVTEKPPPPPAELPVSDKPPTPATGLPPSYGAGLPQVFRNDLAVRKQQLDEARYEVELAEVQLGLKQAELREAQTRTQRAKRDLDHMQRLGEARSVSRGELERAKDDLEVAEAQAQQKAFGVREAELRLQQARRRLENLSPAPPPPATWAERGFRDRSHDFGKVYRGTLLEKDFIFVNRDPAPAHIAGVRVSNASVTATAEEMEIAPGKATRIRVRLDTNRFSGGGVAGIYVSFDRPRQEQVTLTVRADVVSGPPAGPPNTPPPADRDGLRELEKKLDTLLKEVESLRRELRQRKESRGATDPGVTVVNHRKFKLPFRVEQNRTGQVNAVELWASTDGRNWQLVDTAPATADAFTYTAPEDGLYLFATCTVDDQGRRAPDLSSLALPTLKVRVETAK